MAPFVRLGLGAAMMCTLLLAACGGGGGGGGGGYTAILADADHDGVVDSAGWYTFDPASGVGLTGDMEGSYYPGYEVRQLYAFDLGTPPAGIRVTHAELQLWQHSVTGSPYTKNGNVIVDHVDYVADPGPDSFDGQNLERDIGTLSTSPAIGLRTLDVTEAVRGDLAAGRGWSQYRLRFWQPIILPIIDHANDCVRFTTAEGPWAQELPTLVIHYE